MNHKTFWLWLFIVGVFLGLTANVQAETIPATSTPTYNAHLKYTLGSCSKTSATELGGDHQVLCPFLGVAAVSAIQCQLPSSCSTVQATVTKSYACPNGGTMSAYQCWGAPPTCPAGQGWTLSGSSCSRPDCPVGFDRNAQGQCVKDCTGKSGQATVNPKYSFDGAVSDWSVGGCKVRCNVRVLASGGGNGSECKFTGVSASPEQPEAEALTPDPTKIPPETPADCTSQGLGYITGSSGVRCVPSGDAPEGQKPTAIETDSTKESGKPGTDGSPDPNAPDYKKEETTTENKNGTTTEKTTTTTNGTPDGNGGTTCPEGFTLVPNTTQCTKTTVSKSNTSDFCTANPTAKACLGTEESDECLKNPDRIGCIEKGTPGTTPDIESEDRGTNVVTPVDLAQINSCPQGMLLPKGLGYYDFQPMCDFATGLKPVILAIAWLSAFLIVLGFSQGDD